MNIRDDKARATKALPAFATSEQPLRMIVPDPSQLYRRSIAALYAREKAAADFRRVSRRLLQI
jgi:hypothetical protein